MGNALRGFWALRWAIKGPILAVVALFVLGAFAPDAETQPTSSSSTPQATSQAGGSQNSTPVPPATPSATPALATSTATAAAPRSTSQTTATPAPAAPSTATTAPTSNAPTTQPPSSTATVAASVSYPSCDAARAAGVAPMKRGEPGYRPGLDRDNDGIACDD
ncbi:MAG: excalibur calcium-binding domain-containing protein [Dehalococcoidia bacterium]